MKNQTIALIVFSTLFVSACQQETTPAESAPVVAEPQETSAEQAVDGDPKFVCFLDEINDVVLAPTTDFSMTDTLVLRGWIGFMAGNGTSVGNFDISLVSAEQNFNFPAVAGLARQDVADTEAKPGLVNSGYETVLKLQDVTPGVYEVRMSSTLNGQLYGCNTEKVIVVK